jgi:hypothetical protein
LQPSVETAFGSLNGLVTALEQLCNELELALRAADWNRMGVAIADSRRTMAEFENAMAEAKPLRTADFDQVIFARLQRVYSVRADQMKRLQAANDEIGKRLRTISRWKSYARSIGGPDVNRTPSRLFSDVR